MRCCDAPSRDPRVVLMTSWRSVVALDAALPAIDRRHRRADVDAGGEPLVDERRARSPRRRSSDRHRWSRTRTTTSVMDRAARIATRSISDDVVLVRTQLLYCSWRVAKADSETRVATPNRSAAARGASQAGRAARWSSLLAVVLIVDALVGDRGLLAMLRARRQYDELSAAIARQRAENARLREEARRLRDDPTRDRRAGAPRARPDSPRREGLHRQGSEDAAPRPERTAFD